MRSENNNVYQCWMCGQRHGDAREYLWHIRDCEKWFTGRMDGLVSKVILPVSIAKK